LWCDAFIAVGCREHGGEQLRLAWATAETVQRASHPFAMTYYVRYATDYRISLPVFPTRDVAAFTSVKQAEYVNSRITIQNYPAAGRFVTPANEITFSHCSSPLEAAA
jgi:hypothetical protein